MALCNTNIIPQLLDANDTVKWHLSLGGKTAADFRLTAESQQCEQLNDVHSAWASDTARGSTPGADDGAVSHRGWGPGGPCGTGALQKVLDAVTIVGVADGERDDLLRGLSAVLHLGQVRGRNIACLNRFQTTSRVTCTAFPFICFFYV